MFARRFPLTAVALAVSLLAGCEPPYLPDALVGGGASGDESAHGGASTGSDTPPDEPFPTYHGFARGFIEQHCTRCHAPDGVAPFAFSDWSTAQPLADAIVDAVVVGRMPPHLPRDGCRDIVGLPIVPAADIALLEAWRTAGFPEGDPGAYHQPQPDPIDTPAALGDPDLSFTLPQPFTAPRGPDVSHEAVVVEAFPEDTWVVATELVPTATSVVHHATAFVSSEARTNVPAPTSLLAAYAPGYSPIRLPADSALFVPAGASISVFVHYSTIGLLPDEPVPEDTTALRLWTLPPGSAPAGQAYFDPISASDLFLPAFAPHIEVSGERALGLPGARIVGVVPHMHLLGTAFRSEVVRADGTVECLVDIPSYAFQHQSLVLFSADAQLAVEAFDVHRMTCTFDNSQANQPLINGVPQTPSDVSWGDASTDEMCVDALLRVAPLVSRE